MSKKVLKEQGRQGDTWALRALKTDGLEKILKDLGATTIKANEGFVSLVEGEATNHHHGFKETDLEWAKEVPMRGGAIKLKIAKLKDKADYQHYHTKLKELTKEHDTIKICKSARDKGIFAFVTQRESSVENSIRAVVD